MVHRPDTLVEQCIAMEAALSKLQPRLKISHLCVPVKQALAASDKSASAIKCSICSGALTKGSAAMLSCKVVDYDELEMSAPVVKVVCSACQTVSCLKEVMSIYLSETMVSNEETSSMLSTLIDHFLTVNGHNDVGIFNAALSLSVSLRKCQDRLLA